MLTKETVRVGQEWEYRGFRKTTITTILEIVNDDIVIFSNGWEVSFSRDMLASSNNWIFISNGLKLDDKTKQKAQIIKSKILNSYSLPFSALFSLNSQQEKIEKILKQQFFHHNMPKCNKCNTNKKVVFNQISKHRDGIGEISTLVGEFRCPIHRFE